MAKGGARLLVRVARLCQQRTRPLESRANSFRPDEANVTLNISINSQRWPIPNNRFLVLFVPDVPHDSQTPHLDQPRQQHDASPARVYLMCPSCIPKAIQLMAQPSGWFVIATDITGVSVPTEPTRSPFT